MAKKLVKSKFKKLGPKSEKIFSSGEVAVLLENINDNIKMVAEGHLVLDGKIDNLVSSHLISDGKIENLASSHLILNNKIDNLFSETNLIKEDMHSSFSSILNYVSHIETEISEIKSDIKKIIEGKSDKKEAIIIEQRVTKLELELGECKKMIAAAKKS